MFWISFWSFCANSWFMNDRGEPVSASHCSLCGLLSLPRTLRWILCWWSCFSVERTVLGVLCLYFSSLREVLLYIGPLPRLRSLLVARFQFLPDLYFLFFLFVVVYSFVLSWTEVCFVAVVLAFLLYIMMCNALVFCIFCMSLISRGMSVDVLERMFLPFPALRLCSSLYCSILEFLVDLLVPFLYSRQSLVLVGYFVFLIGVPFVCLNFSYSKWICLLSGLLRGVRIFSVPLGLEGGCRRSRRIHWAVALS